MVTHSVDVWMIYISARIRQARREHPGEEVVIRDWATKAYELALEYAGFGFQNHVLWKAYLQYLKVATSGEPQHMVILRQVYQRLVCHPMTGLDQLWQEYEQFERQQSEALAQALLGEFSPKYQHSRTVYLERNRVFNVQDLHMDRLATPPQEVSEEHPCLQLWKTRTAYERTNPERLSTSDLVVRIRTCYKEMVCSWTRHPEVWHMWSIWEESSKEIGRALRVLELGQTHIPDCTLLAFAQAQMVELHEDEDPSKCLAVMETFLERAPNTLGYALHQQMVRRYKGKEAARAVFSKARRVLLTHAEASETATAIKTEETAVEGEEVTDVKKEDITNSKAWMVTNRLDESVGKTTPVPKDDPDKRTSSIKPGPITWHLYAAHATIEHRNNHAPTVAARIYELGLRKHGSFLTQPAYVLRYAQLLLELQDTVNLRALLTRALAACSSRKSPQVAALWDMAVQFESLVSLVDPTNVPAVVALEKKRRAALFGPDVEDVATGIRVGLGDQPTIGAQKSTVGEHLVRQDGYELSSGIVNGMSRTVDVLDIMGLWGSGSGNSNPLGSTITATQAVEDEE
jgi:cleavage stimulation factor subunit 3